jgi:hypothetical protein
LLDYDLVFTTTKLSVAAVDFNGRRAALPLSSSHERHRNRQ